MTDPSMRPRPDGIAANRLDITAFIAALIIGLASYAVLQAVGASQLVVTAAVVTSMTGYALTVARVPRLRVRLDQAGDNAYYLGLLFTLVSMAVALYEFGVADAESTDGAGTRQIIANFGIALGTTITGIFLRIVLHQIRIDPADVEAMTRIELAEAARRVKAILDNVAIETAQLVDEMRQRSSDQLSALVTGTSETLQGFVSRTVADIGSFVDVTTAAQVGAVTQVAKVTTQLGLAVDQVSAAVVRLGLVEPPPLKMATRLDKVAGSLEAVGHQIESVSQRLTSVRDGADTAAEALAAAATRLSEGADRAVALQQQSLGHVVDGGSRVGEVLASLGVTIETERRNLVVLGEQLRISTLAARESQEASTKVLASLTAMVRGVTTLIDRQE